MMFWGIKRLEQRDKKLEELEEGYFKDIPTTNFDITQIIDKPITIIHKSLKWDAKGIIIEEYREYTFVNRLRVEEITCRPLSYGMILERLGEEKENLYLLSTPNGGGGWIINNSSRNFSKLDEKLKDYNL